MKNDQINIDLSDINISKIQADDFEIEEKK